MIGTLGPSIAAVLVTAEMAERFSSSSCGKDHPGITAAAYHQSAENVVAVCPCRRLLDFDALLHSIKSCLIDQWFMGILNGNPILFWPRYNSLILKGFRLIPLAY